MKALKIYIASSWKNQHAVEMLTALLRERGHTIFSFVENNHGENTGLDKSGKAMPFDEWCASDRGQASFIYDTDGATKTNLVIYISPSGTDAWAEVGAAWASGVPIIGLWAKGEQAGLMRRMVEWSNSYTEILQVVDMFAQTPVAAGSTGAA